MVLFPYNEERSLTLIRWKGTLTHYEILPLKKQNQKSCSGTDLPPVKRKSQVVHLYRTPLVHPLFPLFPLSGTLYEEDWAFQSGDRDHPLTGLPFTGFLCIYRRRSDRQNGAAQGNCDLWYYILEHPLLYMGLFTELLAFSDSGRHQCLLSDHQYFLELPVYWGLSPGAYYQCIYPDTDMRYALCILRTTFHLAAENIWSGTCISRDLLPVRNIHDSQICSSLQIRRWNQDWPAANGRD